MLYQIKRKFPITYPVLIYILTVIVLEFIREKFINGEVIVFLLEFVVVPIILYFFIKMSLDTLKSIKVEMSGLKEPTEKKFKGLIVLCSIGKGISSAENTIEYHFENLKKCWLITGGRESEKNAQDMVAKFIKKGASPELFKLIGMLPEESNDPSKVKKKIEEEIYNKLPEGIDESDVIGDYTGGTKSMTAGLILSCILPSRNLQFMKPNKLDENGYTVFEEGSNPVEVNINFKIKQVKKQK